MAAYGQSLAVENAPSEEAAFLEAAARLRTRSDLPADLRASAGRAQARVLFRAALRLYEGLNHVFISSRIDEGEGEGEGDMDGIITITCYILPVDCPLITLDAHM